MLNVSADRFRFAVGLGAAMVRGQTNLLPPNHTPDMVARLREAFPATYCLADDPLPGIDLPMIRHPASNADAARRANCRSIDADTDDRAGADLGIDRRAGAACQALGAAGAQCRVRKPRGWPSRWAGTTWPASSWSRRCRRSTCTASSRRVLMALLGGAAFDTGRPFYPADIARALARTPRPRMLVTTPFHLKTAARRPASRCRRSTWWCARPRRCRRSWRRGPRRRSTRR